MLTVTQPIQRPPDPARFGQADLTRNLGSDNMSRVDTDVLSALSKANDGYQPYGLDTQTAKAVAQFKTLLGDNIDVFFVPTGTMANICAIQSLIPDRESAIICAKTAHLAKDETTAVENFIGARLLTVEAPNGKLTPDIIQKELHSVGDFHCPQPKVVSITQPTEQGTLYTVAELKALADFAHQNQLKLHVDGARIANAVAALNVPIKTMITDTGIDALTFGGTKNGALMAEAVVVFSNPQAAQRLPYIIKRAGGKSARGWTMAVQFSELLARDKWLKNAQKANTMAQYLAQQLKKIPGVTLHQPVETNAVFVTMPEPVMQFFQEKTPAYGNWDGNPNLVRLMTSFDTTKRYIKDLVQHVLTRLHQSP